MNMQQITKNSGEARIKGKETTHRVVVSEGRKEP
jgi:hypothetical protein